MNDNDDRPNSSGNRFRDVLNIVTDLTQLAFRDDYIYRGEAACYPKVSSSLYREYPDFADHFDIAIVQKAMLQAAREFVGEINDDEFLTQLQHYGCSTNLIDFTTDLHIALFFACDGHPDEDGRIIFLRKGDYPIMKPVIPANRVVAQKSILVHPPKGVVEPHYTVVIPHESKDPILEHLCRCHGVTAAAIYKDIHGFIKYHKSHETAYAAFYAALGHWKKKEYVKAIKYYDKAIAQNPRQAVSYANRGVTYSALGMCDSALEDYNKAIELDPNSSSAYGNRGNLHARRGDYESALQDHNRALELDPISAPNYSDRGTVYKDIGRYDLAIQDYNRAIKLAPGIAAVHDNRGVAYSAKGEHDLAIRDHNRAIELHSQFALAYNNRGCAWFRKYDHERAIKDFGKAIELNPEYSVAYYNRAESWMCLNNWEKAEVDLRIAQNQGLDVARAFQNEFGSIAKFERAYGIQLPKEVVRILDR